MISCLNENLCREIIIDHITNPRNVDKKHDGYLLSTLKNPSCGDIVTIYVLKDDNNINDITYEVNGCSICKASTSMMSELFINKTIIDILKIIDNFNKMITDQEYDEQILGDMASLRGVKNIQPRIKCATLANKAFLEAIGLGDSNEN